ncbi:hypothetical protein [Catellatospora sichuanensis]|uniref:hypothetical protein n=1 Tax=Catellatospora sichuanensis TaxID=1969805 RepID=UPI001182CE6A|nr:hypothetical protein [Catellatospora sichuanensis]
MKLSTAQIKTLTAVAANGGVMNGYAGQKGFYCNSTPALVRMGLLQKVDNCAGCDAHGYWAEKCEAPIKGKGGNACYYRVQITEAGRTAIA